MKAVTHFFVLCIFVCLMFQSCFVSYNTITGNGVLVREKFTISDYNEILLNTSAELIYNNDTIAPPYLQIYTDENILPHINLHVKNGKLIIESEDGVNLRATKFTIFTNSGNLNTINISGSGKVYLKGEVNAGEMKMNIAGSGFLAADSLYCERVTLNISGSGSVNLNGVSTYSKFKISGSGKIDALQFSSLEANTHISGSGNIKLWAGSKLKATISGSGNIQYKGYPEIEDMKVSGSGCISRIE